MMKSLNALVQAVQWPQSYDFFPKAANFWQRKFRLAHFCLILYMGTLAPFSVIFWRKNVQLSEYFCIFARETIQITATMATATSIQKPAQMIITLEDNALVADIKRALKLIRGVASVRVATIGDDNTITPAMQRSINKARREYANGETIKCSTPEEMQRYFDSL